MAEVKEVTVPDIGDFSDVPVIEVLVSAGDTVAVEDPLVTLESDKATMDVPAPFAGVVQELRVNVGDKVAEGTPLLLIEVGGNGAAPTPAPEETKEPGQAPAVETALEAETGSAPPPPKEVEVEAPPYASPAVRKLARERGIDLSTIQGTGRKGRITKEDLEGGAAAPAAAPAAPAAPVAAGERVERVELSRIKKISGPNLVRSWTTIPHVTQHDEADITELEAFRKDVNASQKDVKVTMVALLVKAVVRSLQEYPEVNASLDEDGEHLLLKRYWNIGFAADTPQGLVVPVIKDADRKGILEIAGELTRLSGAARDGKLKLPDMQDATFTISSLGGIGGTFFTPIVNAPQVAILGASRSAMKPVWDGSAFQPRLILPLSLSYDHRVVDGALAARFTTHLAGVLADLRRVLL